MYGGNLGEIDFGWSRRKVRVSGDSLTVESRLDYV